MYDARMEMSGWSNASFDDSSWEPVQNNDEFKGNPKYKGVYKLSYQPMAPIRAIELMAPLSVTPIRLLSGDTTVFVFKFPQNAAGWARLQVSNCPKNQVITMYFSEVLCGGPNTCAPGPPGSPGLPGGGLPGTVDQRGLSPHQPLDPPSKRNQYICKGGGGMEVYEPRFTYIGHRYVELHGFPGNPTADNLQQRVVHSDVEAAPAALAAQTVPRRPAGSIAFAQSRCYEGAGCSAARPTNATAPAVLDQIAHNVRWGLIDNLHSVPEDCDQRNERWGWMGKHIPLLRRLSS